MSTSQLRGGRAATWNPNFAEVHLSKVNPCKHDCLNPRPPLEGRTRTAVAMFLPLEAIRDFCGPPTITSDFSIHLTTKYSVCNL